jgi:hypothetical protein
MEQIKPWQIILIVVAVGVLGFSVWKQISKPSIDLPNSVTVVDVTTGDLYTMKLGKRNGAYFPEKNPESGKNTLMPIVKNENGDWYVDGHAMGVLQDVNGEINVVDEVTGKVTIESEEILGTLGAGG